MQTALFWDSMSAHRTRRNGRLLADQIHCQNGSIHCSMVMPVVPFDQPPQDLARTHSYTFTTNADVSEL